MNSVILKGFSAPEINLNEINRYMGCPKRDDSMTKMISDALSEAEFSYKAVYTVTDIKVSGNTVDFGSFKAESEALTKNLSDCKKTIVFACTVGVGIDRLIAKYSKISPAKALVFQAIGSERAEALADTFCKETEKELGIKLGNRFSAGYGDLPLSTQKDIFALLNCNKYLGLSLSDSFLISPTKSVTAFIGIKEV